MATPAEQVTGGIGPVGEGVSALQAIVQVVGGAEQQPLHEQLRKGTDLHNSVLRRLQEMEQRSEQHIQQRHADWQRVDEQLRAYQDLTTKARRADKTEEPRDREMPWGRSIIIPTTYALLWALVYQETALQTSRDPILHYQGRSPEDVKGAWLLEGVARWDLEQSGDVLAIYQTVFDRHRYGFSVIHVGTSGMVGGIPAGQTVDVAFRVVDADNKWIIRCTSDTTKLIEVSGGSETERASGTAAAGAVSFQAIGSAIALTYGYEKRLTYSSATHATGTIVEAAGSPYLLGWAVCPSTIVISEGL